MEACVFQIVRAKAAIPSITQSAIAAELVVSGPSLSEVDVMKINSDNSAQIELVAKIQSCRILADDNLHPALPILSYKDRVMFSLGDFSMITGKAKSRKTFVLSLFIAVLLAQKAISGILPTLYPNKKRILWFDTEQSKYHAQKVLRRILKQSELKDAGTIEFYSLRGNGPKECKKIIEFLTLTGNAASDILIVVIDGIKDLVYDINDSKEATELATWLMKITADKELHICTVLHQNKGENNNARGHLGTETTNKAQTVLSTEKDANNSDYSIVKCVQSREMDFEDFAFTVNNNGLPVIDEVYSPSQTNRPQISKLARIEDSIKQVLTPIDSIQYMDLVRKLVGATACSEPTAKRYITIAEANKWVTKGQDGRYRISSIGISINRYQTGIS